MIRPIDVGKFCSLACGIQSIRKTNSTLNRSMIVCRVNLIFAGIVLVREQLVFIDVQVSEHSAKILVHSHSNWCEF